MTKSALKEVLAQEVEAWSRKSFWELRRQLENTVAYVKKVEAGSYQIEVILLEAGDEHCHVGISVDDMTLCRAIMPLSTSFISHRDGRIEK